MLVESILWYGCDYGVGDPLRWSELRVEMLLLDFFPRKVVVEEAFLVKLPAVLSAFVAFAMQQLGEREGLSSQLVATLSGQVLETIDEITPEYFELIADGADAVDDEPGPTVAPRS